MGTAKLPKAKADPTAASMPMAKPDTMVWSWRSRCQLGGTQTRQRLRQEHCQRPEHMLIPGYGVCCCQNQVIAIRGCSLGHQQWQGSALRVSCKIGGSTSSIHFSQARAWPSATRTWDFIVCGKGYRFGQKHI